MFVLTMMFSRSLSASTKLLTKRFASDSAASTATTPYLEQLFSLEGYSAIITGGGTGIGYALAMGLARAGASVILTGRREGPLEDACEKIQKQLQQDKIGTTAELQARACFCPFDITDCAELPSLLKEAEYMTGIPPTILVNNAGINVRQKAADLTSEHWYQSLTLMLTAPFMLTRTMSNNMKERKHGRVITIASLQSYQAFPDSIPYAAAKSGVLGLTRALAEAYSPPHGYEGITCNAIAPGFVKTDLTASIFANEERSQKLADATLVGRNSVPEDLVGAAVFLSSPAASYITGQTLPVDGGFTALGMR